MHYTIGNNQPGPTSPTNLSQLDTAAGLNKFTAHGAVADTETRVKADVPFDHWLIIRQTQKGGGKNGVKYGFQDSAGHWIGLVGSDQDAPCMLTKAQSDAHGGNVYFVAEYLKAGDYSFYCGVG